LPDEAKLRRFDAAKDIEKPSEEYTSYVSHLDYVNDCCTVSYSGRELFRISCMIIDLLRHSLISCKYCDILIETDTEPQVGKQYKPM